MRSRRSIALVLAALTGGVSLACGVGMARRVAAYHEAHPRHLFAFLRVHNREFTYAGRPVRLADDRSDPANPYLVVTYGDATERLRVTIPGDYRLPDLLPHEDWMRVLLFTPLSGMTVEEFERRVQDGTARARLVIVTRTPRAGTDPRTWGSVMKKDWSFDFYELTESGVIVHEHLKYPTTRGVAPPKPGELQENTWQFQAALQLMPQAGGVGPTHNFFGDALSAAGWLLPLGAFSGLACTLSLAFAFAPSGHGGWSWRRGAGNGARPA
jgi:hypothetical protein